MKRSYTILYVDDDMDDLLLISHAFEKYTDHLRVTHAGDGAEGLKTLERMNREGSLPCLVILDINMPRMNGREMLLTMREHPRFRQLPVILFSTSASEDEKRFADSMNAEFVTKPQSYSELESLVAGFVTKCQFEKPVDLKALS